MSHEPLSHPAIVTVATVKYRVKFSPYICCCCFRQEGNVFATVRLSVCFFALNKITRKLFKRFLRNLVGLRTTAIGRTLSVLGLMLLKMAER